MRPPRDTSPDVWTRQLAAYRAMLPEERLQRAFQLSEDVKGIARVSIRSDHPDWSDSEVAAELGRRMFGPPRQRHDRR